MNNDLISRKALIQELRSAKYLCYDNNSISRIGNHEIDRCISFVETAPTVEDERIGRALETIQTVIDNTNGSTDNMAKAIRNTAKFIKQAIDEEAPVFENVEGEGCEARPQGEWIEDSGNIACSHCYTIWLYRKTDFCPNCGAKMKGGAE